MCKGSPARQTERYTLLTLMHLSSPGTCNTTPADGRADRAHGEPEQGFFSFNRELRLARKSKAFSRSRPDSAPAQIKRARRRRLRRSRQQALKRVAGKLFAYLHNPHSKRGLLSSSAEKEGNDYRSQMKAGAPLPATKSLTILSRT